MGNRALSGSPSHSQSNAFGAKRWELTGASNRFLEKWFYCMLLLTLGLYNHQAASRSFAFCPWRHDDFSGIRENPLQEGGF